MSRARGRELGRRRAPGRSTTSRMPSRCRFSDTGHVEVSPSVVRATIDRDFAGEVDELLEHAGHAAHRAECRGDVGGGAARESGPCRRSPCARSSRCRARARHRRGARRRARRSTANGATSKPWPARNAFSRMRSCAIATLARRRRHARARARGTRARPPGTFSNSVVAARTSDASRASPALSR